MSDPGPRSLEDFEQEYDLNTAETEVLGSGGFSKVYRCTHRTTKVQSAVKVAPYLIPNNEKKTQLHKDQLLREAKISALCKSPDVVEFLGLFMGRAEIYIVFELVSGGELFDAIVQKDHFSEREASKCMQDIMRAVQVCHRNNVIHRDIKPENLLLTEDGHFKLADFGLAVIATTVGCHGFCGTPAYMAPELVGSRDRGTDIPKTPYDHAVDMWACGVILYILLVGYQPFWAEEREDLYAQIEEGQCEYPEDFYSVSSPALELVKALLRVDPKERLTADQALESEWIRDSDAKAKSEHRSKAIKNLRGFNARRKFRAGVNAVVAAARVGRYFGRRAGQAAPAAVADPALEDTGEVESGVREANRRLLKAILERDWEAYTMLVDPALTCFEPEAPGVLVEGLDFHKFYFDLPRGGSVVTPQTTLIGERVTPMGPGVALQTYSRVTQAVSATGVPFTMKSEETRVWRAVGGGRWVCAHFHRSGAPSAPIK